MPRSCISVYLHLVWATWDRLPLISPEMEEPLHACILRECRELRCQPFAVGGIEDHVHTLVQIPSTITIAELVKQLKGSSSHFANHCLSPDRQFKWQGTYGSFSVNPHEVDRVRHYIQRQREHHHSGDLWPDWEKSAEYDDRGGL